MKRLVLLPMVLVAIGASAVFATMSSGQERARALKAPATIEILPFTFFLTHYELLGDPNSPTGVRYHSTGHPYAEAPDGSRVTLSGEGSWDPASGEAKGGGHYTIEDPQGVVTAHGKWRATSFVQFLQLPGWWGIAGFVEKGWQGPPGSPSFSGSLEVNIRLQGLGQGLLTVWCLMPEVPKPGDHVSDGITLTGDGLNFIDYHGSEQTFEGVMFYGQGR